ncbi:MAG TPA: transcriptional regulator [Chitinophagales bacterium]|nr:transcriptional regulator [Chitinophagales bacterium]
MKVIKNEKDYSAASKRLEKIFSAKPDTPEGDEAEVLVILMEDYEKKNFSIEAPLAVDAIRFRMEQMNLKQVDLIPYLGTKERVSEVLSGKRNLTLDMMIALHDHLGISFESLIRNSSKRKEKRASKSLYSSSFHRERFTMVQEPAPVYKKKK